LKLLVLDQFSEPGGAQQALLDLLPAFRERRWQVAVAMPGDGACFARVREAGCEAVPIECGPYGSGRKSPADLVRFAAETPRLARQMRTLAAAAGLVYINGPRLLPAAARAGLHAPVLFHSHSFLPAGYLRVLAGHCLRRMNARVIANCRFVADQWRRHVEPGRVSVVYNGVSGTAMPKQPAGGPPHVGCIGRIAPEKGQLEFVRVARMIQRALPDCRFSIWGAPLFADASYEAEVREAAHDLPVQFRGWTPDVYAALAELDLLLVPSMAHEATTRVIPEAFAAGVPVVAFASGGIPELIEDGANGFLADSVEQMAQAAIRLLQGDRTAVSRAARETWRRRFTLDRYRREVISILNNMAAPPASMAAPASTGP
jgi:glycosyltransferase involved in cell wall biosynthesis